MSATKMLFFLFLVVTPMVPCSGRNNLAPRARALIYRAVTGGNPSTAIGVLDLERRNGVVSIIGSIDGLPPGPHGFHVHQYGDLGNGCLAAGDHFNPRGSVHGGPRNSTSKRHVGDLGNIITPQNDSTLVDIRDSLIAFAGVRGIVGRAFVIHANVDDLGTGGNAGSAATGNAGGRLACGIIGYVA